MCIRLKTRYSLVADSSVISFASHAWAHGNPGLTCDPNNLSSYGSTLTPVRLCDHWPLDGPAGHSSRVELFQLGIDVTRWGYPKKHLLHVNLTFHNVTDSDGEVVQENLISHNIYAGCKPKKRKENACGLHKKKKLTVSSWVLTGFHTSYAIKLQRNNTVFK